MTRRCVSSFVTADGRSVAAGELVEDHDPVIEGREVFFVPLEVAVADAEKPTPDTDDTEHGEDTPVVPPTVDPRAELRDAEEKADDEDDERDDTPAVEEATAAPGEKRNTSRSKK